MATSAVPDGGRASGELTIGPVPGPMRAAEDRPSISRLLRLHRLQKRHDRIGGRDLHCLSPPVALMLTGNGFGAGLPLWVLEGRPRPITAASRCAAAAQPARTIQASSCSSPFFMATNGLSWLHSQWTFGAGLRLSQRPKAGSHHEMPTSSSACAEAARSNPRTRSSSLAHPLPPVRPSELPGPKERC